MNQSAPDTISESIDRMSGPGALTSLNVETSATKKSANPELQLEGNSQSHRPFVFKESLTQPQMCFSYRPLEELAVSNPD
jgi:hypothetical protein